MKTNCTKTASYSFFVFALFTQCKQKSDNTAYSGNDAVAMQKEEIATDASAAPTNTNSTIPSQSADSSIQRMFIKEATLRWETSNIDKTHATIIEHSKKMNVYIANDNQTRTEYEITNEMLLRIPSDKLDDFLTSIENEVTKFDEKRIDVVDVTEEYIDVAARMKTKKELEQHYYDLLKQTKNVAEVLQVEQQLNNVRAEIESAEGRLKYLKDKVNMSTLHLTFYETTSAPVGFFGEIGKSFVAGWKGFLYFILGIIRAWPILLIITLVSMYLIRKRRKLK